VVGFYGVIVAGRIGFYFLKTYFAKGGEMTFNAGIRPLAPVTFSIKNDRECNWIFKYICSLPNSHISDLDAIISPEARKQTINDSLDDLKMNFADRKDWVDRISARCAEALIPESEFEWIDEQNEILYRWLHAYLIFHHVAPFMNAVNFEEYRKDIITFFDISLKTRLEKQNFLSQLKGYWEIYFRVGEKFKWLDKNDRRLVEWAWNYFKSNNIPLGFTSFSKESEVYVGLIVMFELWEAHTDTKKLFIFNMKKALSQKKQRDKLDGKKAYNIVMSEDIKQKLDALAKEQDRKINQTLERLINKEYEKLLKRVN